jgi:metal-dependent amidase/aminoacylase/carboxypeptidase family protein
MIKEGCLEGIDEIYGIHNWPAGEEGKIVVKNKDMMAGVVVVHIEVTGKGGHGSEPALSIDPITAGCMIHNALHTIKSRKMLNSSVAAFTICKF